MVNVLVAIYGIYIFIKIVLEIKEVIFIKNEFEKGPVLMSLEEYKEAALYSVNRHTIEIFNALISMFLVIFWLSGGLFIINFLLYKESLLSELLILFSFFAINYILRLPVLILEKNIDKKFGFNVASWKEFFIDEVKKIIIFIIFGGVFLLF